MGTLGNALTLLCVDDEATGLSVRKTVLESQGYRVFTAESGLDALLVFSNEVVDLVILDYSMPEMNGNVVAQKMRASKPGVPIVMLSAYLDLPGEMLTLVDRSLTKGEPPQALLDAITELLRERPARRAQSAA